MLATKAKTESFGSIKGSSTALSTASKFLIAAYVILAKIASDLQSSLH